MIGAGWRLVLTSSNLEIEYLAPEFVIPDLIRDPFGTSEKEPKSDGFVEAIPFPSLAQFAGSWGYLLRPYKTWMFWMSDPWTR